MRSRRKAKKRLLRPPAWSRVVVTGMGAVTPLGNNVEAFWQRLCAGDCGIDTISLFDATPYQTQIAAEIGGYSNTLDAFHETRPQHEGIHLAQSMRQALWKTAIEPADVDAIFAHATGTRLGDIAEANAMTLALGAALPQIPVVALKAALGHTLGAAGAIQVIAATQSLSTQTLPPTLNVEQLDPQCKDLRILPTVSDHPMQNVLSNAAGFGGHNVSLVLQRFAYP